MATLRRFPVAQGNCILRNRPEQAQPIPIASPIPSVSPALRGITLRRRILEMEFGASGTLRQHSQLPSEPRIAIHLRELSAQKWRKTPVNRAGKCS
jgi:hypothetical protein